MVPPAQVHYVCSQTVHKISPAPTTRRSKKTQVYEGVGQSGMSRNAARERFRVKSLRNAFHSLQQCLPSVPRNTKLPKLDVLVLATNYISYLSRILSEDEITQENGFSPSDFELLESSLGSLADTEVKNASWEKSYLHPVKKWPMRSRLYAGVEEESSGITDCSTLSIHQRITWSDCL